MPPISVKFRVVVLETCYFFTVAIFLFVDDVYSDVGLWHILHCLCSDILCRKPVKSADFHSYVKNLERDSGLLFTVEYEVGF